MSIKKQKIAKKRKGKPANRFQAAVVDLVTPAVALNRAGRNAMGAGGRSWNAGPEPSYNDDPDRKRTMLRNALVLVVSVCAAPRVAPCVAAREMVLDLDPTKSQVNFILPGAMHTVHGSFKLKSGTVRFNPATGNAAGEVIVDVTSGESGNRARDRSMHQDILESSRYPDAIFAPDGFDGHFGPDGSAELQVHGVFKIHGTEHDVTFPMRIERQGEQVTATTHFVVPYVKWGMKNPSNFLLRVSDKVQIEIRASGHAHPVG